MTLGAPLAAAALGGASAASFLTVCRFVTALTALVWLFSTLIVLARGGFAVSLPRAVAKWGTRVLVCTLGVATLLNFASSSPWERFGWGPFSLVKLILCIRCPDSRPPAGSTPLAPTIGEEACSILSPRRSIASPQRPASAVKRSLVDAAKRAEVIPTSPFTQLVAPVAEILALALVTGLYLAYGRRTGTFGLVAYLLNVFALSALVGVEFVVNLVFRDLPRGHGSALLTGSLGVALTATSMLFLLGTLGFVTAMLRSRQVPAVPLILYAVGAIPISLRAFVPEAVLDLGLVVLAAGTAWLAIWLFGRSRHITGSTREPPVDRPPANPSPSNAMTSPSPLRWGISVQLGNSVSCAAGDGGGCGRWPGSCCCSS